VRLHKIFHEKGPTGLDAEESKVTIHRNKQAQQAQYALEELERKTQTLEAKEKLRDFGSSVARTVDRPLIELFAATVVRMEGLVEQLLPKASPNVKDEQADDMELDGASEEYENEEIRRSRFVDLEDDDFYGNYEGGDEALDSESGGAYDSTLNSTQQSELEERRNEDMLS
jgi:hypothetical protein|tara:strand:- start:5326 stop:5838 length:513 start_codon:yes stop_codon:yes gene_type:complete